MKKKLFLVSCCAPCAVAVIEKLNNEGRDFKVIFFNPNIHPEEEYIKRRDEQKAVCEKFGVEFIELLYEPKGWFESIRGLEDEEERGKRCSVCFYYRIKKVMEFAKECGDDIEVASVLGVSRWKDLKQVNEAGYKASFDTGIDYVEVEGRKGGMQERRNTLIKEMGLYNQDYCGCVFSKKNKLC
ncbi:MAG: epoxyqueuosine reductase QueH [Alphaproteobacteria bacterium]|nr:epoxyqueuosine reductase QueH [Alphaproteobacteria bacterium]